MSAQILQFPIRDSYDKHQASHVRRLAVELGHDPKQAERDFIAAGCPQQVRNDLAERARRARMHNPDNGCRLTSFDPTSPTSQSSRAATSANAPPSQGNCHEPFREDHSAADSRNHPRSCDQPGMAGRAVRRVDDVQAG